jgi:hypothetical protein
MIIINIWIIFAFVAIWHDRVTQLLIWGLLISLFILPEILLTIIGQKLHVIEIFYIFLYSFFSSLFRYHHGNLIE